MDSALIKAKIRNCAFCLDAIAAGNVQICGKCHKRAYCSRECQVGDWCPKGTGQGHKNWCHLNCGEEDLDWEVSPVAGKGLGLIAKRTIPAKFRIMVDSCSRPKTHPAIKELMPLNGTIEEKLILNGLGCSREDDIETALCLRISRANHRCDENAAHFYDKDFKVKILFAEKEILEGEEICINYQSYNDVSTDTSAQMARQILRMKWGIICPADCFCRNEEIGNLIQQSKELDAAIMRLARTPDRALNAVRKLMDNHDVIHSSWLIKARTLYDGFQIAVTRQKTLKQAKEFIQKAHEIFSSIVHPKSAEVLKYEGWLKDIRTHPNYLQQL